MHPHHPTPMTYSIDPIATVRSSRRTIGDDDWDSVEAVIELAAEYPEECLLGLEEFSHVEVFYVLDKVPETAVERVARHPRNNQAWPRVGIFAQRGKNRPNRLGATIVPIIRREGRRLTVRGLDAIDGTPVVDLKPVMAEFLPREPVTQPAWSHELMRGYWKK